MTKMLADGNVKVTYVPSLADITAPDVSTELTGGSAVDLQCVITADGWNVSTDEGVVALPALCDVTDSEAPGRVKYGVDLTFYRHVLAADDIAWQLIDRLLAGCLVVRYGHPHDTAWAADDDAQVLQGQFGALKPLPTEANGGVKFSCKFYVDAAELKAVAVA